ncbi:MAG: hypothetical protein ACO1N9_05515 [Flavobacterium sp.]
MNIALAGFVIIILLLPGLLFRKSYLSGEFSREYIVEDFFELLINSLVPSFIIYIIGIPIAYLFGYFYDLPDLLALLSSDKELLSNALKSIEKHQLPIVIFHLLINILAYAAGYKFKDLVLRKNFDTKFPSLRFDNIWHYLLTAKFILFKRSQIALNNDKIDDIDLTFIVALVNVGNTPILYNGALVDYELSTDSSLNLLYLKNVKRKVLRLKDEVSSDESNIHEDDSLDNFKDIEGNILIIKYENIINLSISFVATDIVKDSDGNIIAIEPRLIS